MNQSKKTIDYKDWLDLYWKHFQLHSEQRMKLLQFYLSAIVVLFGALFTLHSLKTRIIIAETALCIGIALISLTFSFIDHRTSLLIKDAEKAIQKLEAISLSRDLSGIIGLFTISAKNDNKRFYISYSNCIQISEVLVAVISLILAWKINKGIL